MNFINPLSRLIYQGFEILGLWRDLYNWTRIHYSLWDQTPAMAMGLAEEIWSVLHYVHYPVHVGKFQRLEWNEQRDSILESAVEVYNREKCLPI